VKAWGRVENQSISLLLKILRSVVSRRSRLRHMEERETLTKDDEVKQMQKDNSLSKHVVIRLEEVVELELSEPRTETGSNEDMGAKTCDTAELDLQPVT
jgi:hypothetical protein